MTRFATTLLLAAGLFGIAACTQTLGTASQPSQALAAGDEAAFVTLLGADTLAVERFRRTETGMEAHVVVRSPRTTSTRYRLDLDENGQLRRYEARVEELGAAGGTAARRTDVVAPGGSGLEMTVTESGGEPQTRSFEGGAEALPFIDMVHWPFELMLLRAASASQNERTQPLFTARGTMPFVVRRTGAGTMTVTHPTRGTMDVEVDAEGRLQTLSAGATTRKLLVTRVPSFDTEAFARRSATLDAAGQAFGPLSGRGETVAQVDGATLRVDYGQPAKRGREIFGALVGWGDLWRTGADRATHFETDRPLSIGGLDVPAGTYTLYTIPEAGGGTLIINRQTGQGGTTYNEAQDLGRVPMRTEALPETVEVFTIGVEDTARGGELRLMWDRTAFVVPFTVREG